VVAAHKAPHYFKIKAVAAAIVPPQIPGAKAPWNFPPAESPPPANCSAAFPLSLLGASVGGKPAPAAWGRLALFTGGGGVAAVAGAVLKPGGGVGGGGWRKRQPLILKKCGGNSRRTGRRRYESGAAKSRRRRLFAPVLAVFISPQFAFFLACVWFRAASIASHVPLFAWSGGVVVGASGGRSGGARRRAANGSRPAAGAARPLWRCPSVVDFSHISPGCGAAASAGAATVIR
jgi:hypothetical protein